MKTLCVGAGRFFCLLAGLAFLPGCVTAREQEKPQSPAVEQSFLADKPRTLHPHLLVMMRQGPRNQVLNDMRIGLGALDMGEDALASSLFDDALDRIESVYSDKPDAAQARSLWAKESVKDFKGEPYERAMAFYYRGLLYLRAGDYENARASFKSGVLQDAFAEENQHRADFGLLIFLEGWASHCNGDHGLAQESFDEFKRINSAFRPPAKTDNTLLLIESGSAPVKTNGLGAKPAKPKGYLMFHAGISADLPRIQASGGKGLGSPLLLENILFQATTRGGRPIDSIVAGKAQFKDVAGGIGNVLIVGSVGAAHVAGSNQDRNAAYAAAGLLLAGLLAKGVESAVEADADTRYWDNLPDKVFGLTAALPDGTKEIPLEFVNSFGEVEAHKSKAAPLLGKGRCRLAWARSDSAFPYAPRAPNSVPLDVMMEAIAVPPMPEADK